MEKTNPYYEKSMSISFLNFPHTMAFVAFPRTMEMYGEPHAFPIS